MTSDFPKRMTVREGVLVYEDGTEVTLWGENFQPNLYWEYKFRIEYLGIPMTAEVMKEMCDDGFDDLRRMKCNLIRCHLTPADFTDAEGNLVETLWLDMLDYLLAKARENEVYVYLTFMNQMEYTFIQDSFIASYRREEWIFHPDCRRKTENYIRQLLNRINPYTGIRYKDEPVIAVWEPINEPEYFTYQQVMTHPEQKELFFQWLEKQNDPANDVYYARYRYAVVKSYINQIHSLLRDEGAQQPLVWNCNWPRMIDSRRDVFRAVADSAAEAVSFCLYPGQDDIADPFIRHPYNLSDRNYLPFLQHCFDDYDYLGWLRDARFAGKARLVYEFETMYNAESSYLHPAMAKLFRALGVQMATMWTHCFNVYAPYQGGSHVLNLRTTPRKAVGFIVAGQVFRHLPRGFEYATRSEVDDVFDGFALSREHDLSLASVGNCYIHSGSVSWSPVAPPACPEEIIGYGSSPFVTYSGRGLYFIRIGKNEIHIEIFPHARPVRDQWKWSTDDRPVTELDETTVLPFELRLPGCSPVRFDAVPGAYCIPIGGQKPAGRMDTLNTGRKLKNLEPAAVNQ